MQLFLAILLLLSVGVWAQTYAGSCTYYNTLALSGTTVTTNLYSSTCTIPTVSGPYVTQACFTGAGITGTAVTSCSAAVTATTCVSSTITRTSTTAPLIGTSSTSVLSGGGTASTITVLSGGIGITTTTTSTCSIATFAPNPLGPLQPVAGSVCYADNVNGVRTLSRASTSNNVMSNTVCRNFCNNLGFAYSGTEYSSECYCGNTLPTVTSSSCNMACAAAGSTEICGGPNALSVLTNAAIVTSNTQATSLLNSYTSRGCYSDNYPSRVLAAASTSSSSMTLESCATFCNKGPIYQLFGLENGSECYCANALQSDGATYGVAGQPGCTYTCAGNSNQICGGSNVLNVYSKSGSNQPVPIAAPPAPVPSAAGGFTYVACYIDQAGGRTLAINKPPVNGVEACLTACSGSGYRYAGVEYKSECWCDNAIRTGTQQIDAKNCLMQCTGNSTETCGGSNAIQIYVGTGGGVTVPPTVAVSSTSTWNYVDSFVDSPSARIWPLQMTLSSNTVLNCARACSNAGYIYAGLEYGSQCFCGNTRPTTTQGQFPNIACTGDATQFCGGNNILQVYSGTSSPQLLTTPFNNGQCVADNTNNVRTLSVSMSSPNPMTPVICQQLCANYKYYGVEYGSECWCDNSFPSGSVLSGSCTMACAGNQTQVCGGSYALNMYNS